MNVAQDEGVSTQIAEQQAQDAQAQAEAQLEQVDPASAFETVKDAAWNTLAGADLPARRLHGGGEDIEQLDD